MAVLRVGSRGTSVTDLQSDLKAAGFDPGPIDGVYGPLTKAAVEAYQRDKGLTIDGIAGPETLGSLGATASPGADSPADPGATSGAPLTGLADFTDPEETRFNGLPG